MIFIDLILLIGNSFDTVDVKIIKEAVEFVRKWPKSFNDCIAWARNKFEKYFSHDIKQLLHTYPLDHKNENGTQFWTLPKRPPTPQIFDQNNELHVSIIASLACLRAVTCGIKVPENSRDLKTKLNITQIASGIKVNDFVASDKKAKVIKDKNDESNKSNQNNNNSAQANQDLLGIDRNVLLKEFDKLSSNIKSKPNFQEFEKDEDDNYHIDVLYSLTNCRARNYKLENMDWVTVKLKAGKIIPALATTTSSIAALQTIELIKLICQNKKIEAYKNSFLNMSIPLLAQSEPQCVPVFEVTPDIKATLWDRWDIDIGKFNHITNIRFLFKHLIEVTKILEPQDIMKGNMPILISSLMSLPNKAKEKENILNKPLKESLLVKVINYITIY